MAKPIIAAFPSEINLNSFADFLSGFVAGEGYFQLRLHHTKNPDRYCGHAHFSIVLRDDDTKVLNLIQSFWQCGRLFYSENHRSKTNSKPVMKYMIADAYDLNRVVVPHFENHPMYAKKMNDFLIWRRGVKLIAEVKQRPFRLRPPTLTNAFGRPRFGGAYPKWTDADFQQFQAICAELKSQRTYPGSSLPEPSPEIRRESNGSQDNDFMLPGLCDPDS